jgi:hypothetical protein
LNARVALEALGNAFMVKAIELDIKLSCPKAETPSNGTGTDTPSADKLLIDGSKY